MEILPKELINIIEDYAKDRTNYDNVMTELIEKVKISLVEIYQWTSYHSHMEIIINTPQIYKNWLDVTIDSIFWYIVLIRAILKFGKDKKIEIIKIGTLMSVSK